MVGHAIWTKGDLTVTDDTETGLETDEVNVGGDEDVVTVDEVTAVEKFNCGDVTDDEEREDTDDNEESDLEIIVFSSRDAPCCDVTTDAFTFAG